MKSEEGKVKSEERNAKEYRLYFSGSIISSVRMRKNQPAEPVYQVQPASPSRPGAEEMSAGSTKGSAS